MRSHFAVNGRGHATNGSRTPVVTRVTLRTLRGMASARTRPTAPTTRPPRPRRRVDPGRRALLGASVMVVLGSFMVWFDTGVGAVAGTRGPGLWTFYAAALGFAGALVPSRRAAAVQGAVLAAVAVALPVWQVARLLSVVGTSGWFPGPGLVLVLGGGVLAGSAAWRLWRAAGQQSAEVRPA